MVGVELESKNPDHVMITKSSAKVHTYLSDCVLQKHEYQMVKKGKKLTSCQ